MTETVWNPNRSISLPGSPVFREIMRAIGSGIFFPGLASVRRDHGTRQAGNTPFNIDVDAATHTNAFLNHWTDGAFPSDVQPAPLWQSNSGDAYIEVAFSAGGNWIVTADGAVNTNINTTRMYLNVTDTSTGTPPAGAVGDYFFPPAAGPGGSYAQPMSTISSVENYLSVPSAGTWRVWIHFNGNTYHTLKRLYFS